MSECRDTEYKDDVQSRREQRAHRYIGEHRTVFYFHSVFRECEYDTAQVHYQLSTRLEDRLELLPQGNVKSFLLIYGLFTRPLRPIVIQTLSSFQSGREHQVSIPRIYYLA